MGGSSYDREVYSSSSTGAWSSTGSSSSTGVWSSTGAGSSAFVSDTSKNALRRRVLRERMQPSDKRLISDSKHPIVIMLDVTGSNIDFARIVYDKMPMFFGQIEQQGYLDDFDIAVCAVGDANCDKYPLQIPNFGRGIEIDGWLKELVLEGGGGGQMCESYELAALYLKEKFDYPADAEPIIFFLADEKPYPYVDVEQAMKFVGLRIPENTNPFADLIKKVNDRFFLIMNPYGGMTHDQSIYSAWQKNVSEQKIIRFDIGQEKSIVDVMLGVIALSFSARSVDGYRDDMKARGQDSGRIADVTKKLVKLSDASAPVTKISGFQKLLSGIKGIEGSTRL